jgi:hypothetical protein
MRLNTMSIKKQAYSKPYNIVYENKYPNLMIGPGVFNHKEEAFSNTPEKWIKSEVKDVEINRKKQIFAVKNYSKIDAVKNKTEITELQNLIKSDKETEVEIDYNVKRININEKITGIQNKAIQLEKIKIIANIKVSKSVDRITGDLQIKAKDAIIEYYDKTKDVYKLEQLLSIGLLGLKQNRIFVPTRWSITSIDDILGKEFFKNIENNKIIDRIKMHSFNFYNNKFYIIFLPFSWSFEMLEYVDEKLIAQDYEINSPKKEYANQVTGAYYAAREVVLEHLKNINKSARVIVLRDIDSSYSSKGVWVIREAIKEALKKEEIVFDDVNQLIEYIKTNLKVTWIMQKSEILKQIKYQKRIFDF